MPMKLRGLDEMTANLKRIGASAHEQTKTALEAEATRLLDEAKSRTPVDTGALRDSGRVTLVESGTTVKATISFGDEAVDYAVEVHENLEAHHETGEAKFLEKTMNEESVNVAANLAKGIGFGKMLP